MAKLNHGRRRTIDPGFFSDEKVLQLEPLARLLFQALWLLADREGRLEEPHPVQLKVRFFAMDACDPAQLLEQVIKLKLVIRYRAAGMTLLFIPGFPKYQHPHKNEAKSTLPAPGDAEERPAPAAAPASSNGTEEAYWGILERLRIEHCTRFGVEPGESKQPSNCKKRLNDAVNAAGIVDSIVDGEVFTRWDMLTLLFERYLADDFGRAKDGELRSPPWPIELFLSANVLGRLKRKYDEEYAA